MLQGALAARSPPPSSQGSRPEAGEWGWDARGAAPRNPAQGPVPILRGPGAAGRLDVALRLPQAGPE